MTHANRTVRVLGWAGTFLAAATLLAGGCDVRPPAPRTAFWARIQSVPVNPADSVEARAADGLLQAEARYCHALNVLHAHYDETRNYLNRQWVQKELKNLQQARTWQFEGMPTPSVAAAGSIEEAEASLVERVLAARQQWKAALQELADYYAEHKMNFKLALVRNVQQRFDPVHEYAYFLDAEIPPATLRPKDYLQAANDLFERALKLHRQGKPLPGITIYSKQHRALGMFLELVRRYPTSTKVARSAYYIGEIYKEYFNENIRAVQWYERAWQWDPDIQLPARSQAAFVYDLRLHRRAKAVELYRQVIEHEQFAPDRVRYAYQRIEELEKKTP